MTWEDTLKAGKWADKKDKWGRVEDWKFTLPKTLETEEDKKKRRKKIAREAIKTAASNLQVVDDLSEQKDGDEDGR